MKRSELKSLIKEAVREELNEKLDSGSWQKVLQIINDTTRLLAKAIHEYKSVDPYEKEIEKELNDSYEKVSNITKLIWKSKKR